METNSYQLSKNPAYSGIFCFRQLGLFLLLLFSCSLFAQPRLEITEAKKSFGTVMKGEVVKLDYEIKNTGNAPLIINDVEISCSCTSVDFPKQPILPGQTSKVTVSFNTATVYKRQDRIVYLNSNDPKSPAQVRYKGFVKIK